MDPETPQLMISCVKVSWELCDSCGKYIEASEKEIPLHCFILYISTLGQISYLCLDLTALGQITLPNGVLGASLSKSARHFSPSPPLCPYSCQKSAPAPEGHKSAEPSERFLHSDHYLKRLAREAVSPNWIASRATPPANPIRTNRKAPKCQVSEEEDRVAVQWA